MSKSILRNKLKVLRAEKNITQDMLADSIGVTRKTVNTIETGKFIPTTVTALKIAAYFQLRVEDVFYLEGPKKCGVCRILNLRNGKSFLIPSIDTETSIEKHLSELKKGTHRNSELQKDWNEFGPENFLFDVVAAINESSKMKNLDKELDKLMEQFISSSSVKNFY